MPQLRVTFGNVTLWNRKVLSYLEHTTSQVILLAETHLAKQTTTTRAMSDSRLRGWRPEITDARPTEAGGTTGGAAVLVKKHLSATSLAPELTLDAVDWACTGLNLRGHCKVLFVSLYLNDNNSANQVSAENLQKLYSLWRCLRLTGVPFVVGGDWNMTCQQLAKNCTWLDDVKADVVQANLDFTCTAGTGRHIDFFVVSRCLLPAVISAERDELAQWKPHIGIALVLSARPKQALIRTLLSPSKADLEKPAAGWAEAWSFAEDFVATRGVPGIKHAEQGLDTLGLVLHDWAGDVTILSAKWNLAAEKTIGAAKHPVRGQFPRELITSAVPPAAVTSWSHSPVEGFWMEVVNRLHELQLLLIRQKGGQHVLSNLRFLIASLDRFREFYPAWSEDVTDRWHFYLQGCLDFILVSPRPGPTADGLGNTAGSPLGCVIVAASTPLGPSPSGTALRCMPPSALSDGGGPCFPRLGTTTPVAQASQVPSPWPSTFSPGGGGPRHPWLCSTPQISLACSSKPSSGGGGPLPTPAQAFEALPQLEGNLEAAVARTLLDTGSQHRVAATTLEDSATGEGLSHTVRAKDRTVPQGQRAAVWLRSGGTQAESAFDVTVPATTGQLNARLAGTVHDTATQREDGAATLADSALQAHGGRLGSTTDSVSMWVSLEEAWPPAVQALSKVPEVGAGDLVHFPWSMPAADAGDLGTPLQLDGQFGNMLGASDPPPGSPDGNRCLEPAATQPLRCWPAGALTSAGRAQYELSVTERAELDGGPRNSEELMTERQPRGGDPQRMGCEVAELWASSPRACEATAVCSLDSASPQGEPFSEAPATCHGWPGAHGTTPDTGLSRGGRPGVGERPPINAQPSLNDDVGSSSLHFPWSASSSLVPTSGGMTPRPAGGELGATRRSPTGPPVPATSTQYRSRVPDGPAHTDHSIDSANGNIHLHTFTGHNFHTQEAGPAGYGAGGFTCEQGGPQVIDGRADPGRPEAASLHFPWSQLSSCPATEQRVGLCSHPGSPVVQYMEEAVPVLSSCERGLPRLEGVVAPRVTAEDEAEPDVAAWATLEGAVASTFRATCSQTSAGLVVEQDVAELVSGGITYHGSTRRSVTATMVGGSSVESPSKAGLGSTLSGLDNLDSVLQDIPPYNQAFFSAGGLDLSALQGLYLEAQKVLKQVQKEVRKVSNSAFREWAFKAVAKGASAAHAWSRKTTASQGLACKGADEDGTFISEPLGMMDLRRSFWAKLWSKDPAERTKLAYDLGDLRKRAILEAAELPPLTTENLKRAVKAAKATTRWADAWTGPELLHVLQQDGACQEFLRLLGEVEQQAVLPRQATYTVVGLVPKPDCPPSISKAERPICIFSLLYQVWGAMRNQLNLRWERARSGFWDTAVAGSSALMTGLMRALLDEAAELNNIKSASVYFDMEKFYDHVSLLKLIQLSYTLEYPALPLALSVQAFLGRRSLRADQCVAVGIDPTNSLGAGCRRANTFARIILYELLEVAHRKHFLVRSYQFVDDLVQRSEGTITSVSTSLAGAAADIMSGSEALGLKVSGPKTKIAGHPAAAAATAKVLRTLGYDIKVEAEVRDLGIAQSHRGKRRTAIQEKRLKLGLRRLVNVKKLKFTRKVPKLFNTGTLPACSYGNANGWAPRRLAAVRLALKAALAAGKDSGCTTTTIRVNSRSPFEDPGVVLPVRTVLYWYALWDKLAEVRRGAVRRAWHRARDRLAALEANKRWRYTTGPISAAITVLLSLGWVPAEPDEWHSPDGSVWELALGFSSSDIKFALSKDIAKQLWALAARHYHGTGLEEGVDLVAWEKIRQRYLDAKNFSAAGLQANLATAAFWCPQRRLKAGYRTVNCHRCGRGPEAADDLHVFWTCPELAAIKEGPVAASQHLLPQATAMRHPCLWLRGLLPASLTDYDMSDSRKFYILYNNHLPTCCLPLGPSWPPHFAEIIAEHFGSTELDQRILHIYTDGSGGTSSQDRRVRSCGWGALVTFETCRGSTPLWGLTGGLPDGPQTVPHAELHAALQAVLSLPVGCQARVVLHCDATYVCANFSKGRRHTQLYVSHAAKWASLFDAVEHLEAAGSTLTIIKCPSHDTADNNLTFGNHIADGLAASGAHLSLTKAEHRTAEVKHYDEVVRLVVERLVFLGLEGIMHDRPLLRGVSVAGPGHTQEQAQCFAPVEEVGGEPLLVLTPTPPLDSAVAPPVDERVGPATVPAELTQPSQPPLVRELGYSSFASRHLWALEVARRALVSQGHAFEETPSGAALHCIRCRVTIASSLICARSKQDKPCAGELFSFASQPLVAPQTRRSSAALTLREKQLDVSHRLRHFAGLVWCDRCGSLWNLLASGNPVNLSKPCPGDLSGSVANLARLSLLLPPFSVGEWPGPSTSLLAGFT